METTEKRSAGTVKSIIYMTNDSAAECVEKKTLAVQVSACGQVSKWRILRRASRLPESKQEERLI
jgi:hypothetical protein